MDDDTERTQVDMNTHTNRDDYFMGVKELSAYCSLSVRTLRKYLCDPELPIPHFRPDGKVLVKKSEFDGWMENYRVDVNKVDALVEELLHDF